MITKTTPGRVTKWKWAITKASINIMALMLILLGLILLGALLGASSIRTKSSALPSKLTLDIKQTTVTGSGPPFLKETTSKMTSIVDHGASPSNPDNTLAIQAALDAGGTVVVPPGVFMVNPEISLMVHSNTTLNIEGTIKARPTASPGYAMVLLQSVQNITINGPGRIVGERHEHLAGPPGPGGIQGGYARFGFALEVLLSSNVIIGNGLVLSEAWADGLYLDEAKDVRVNGVHLLDNCRNGLSIISGENISVTNSTFEGTNSEFPQPQAGIDIEPNNDQPWRNLININISGNRFVKNKGSGVCIAFDVFANRHGISVIGNDFDQHYKDGSGKPVSGRETWLPKLVFAVGRWIPGYDYWFYPTEFTQA